ncbi:hypothetical protein H0H93_000666 [Arthromyces matolae]|nr:hypothetical protein H0H93_000666 [Arthromyces matolae]
MSDIRNHYALSHPEREQSIETVAPIVYTSLKEAHVTEVNELLERSFWKGINSRRSPQSPMQSLSNFLVRDSLDYWPERCTVVALYKRLVVGVAILSSPRETYITYLAVRAGWDNARIARYASERSVHAFPSHHAQSYKRHYSSRLGE